MENLGSIIDAEFLDLPFQLIGGIHEKITDPLTIWLSASSYSFSQATSVFFLLMSSCIAAIARMQTQQPMLNRQAEIDLGLKRVTSCRRSRSGWFPS